MTPPAQPNNAEVVRRLDDLGAQLNKLIDTIDRGYVRKDVQIERDKYVDGKMTDFERDNDLAHARITNLKTDLDAKGRFRLGSIVVPVVAAVLAACLSGFVTVLVAVAEIHK